MAVAVAVRLRVVELLAVRVLLRLQLNEELDDHDRLTLELRETEGERVWEDDRL